MTIRFEKPLDYTVKELVKLAPTVGMGFRHIVVAPHVMESTRLTIVGILDPEITQRTDAVEIDPNYWRNSLYGDPLLPNGLFLDVSDPGSLRLRIEGQFAFDLVEGSITFPISIDRSFTLLDWCERAAVTLDVHHRHNQLPTRLDGALQSTFQSLEVNWLQRQCLLSARTIIKRAWINILRRVVIARHGGCFLIVPTEAILDDSIVNIKYPIASEEFREAVKVRSALEPELTMRDLENHIEMLKDAPVAERRLARVSDLVASLTAVDGAVLIAEDLNI